MGSLLSVHDMALENDWNDDYGWNTSRRQGLRSQNGSPRRHMGRKPSRRNFDYKENVRLFMGDHVYLSGSNRKVNPKSRKSADSSETVKFTTYIHDSNSGKYLLSESAMSIWTEFIFVEFQEKMGVDAMGQSITAVRLKLGSDQSTQYLVPWSSFTQNFTPFNKEESTRPEYDTEPDDPSWMGYLFNDEVWKHNETHHQAIDRARKALVTQGGSNGGGWR
jgi:hypothetical protein